MMLVLLILPCHKARVSSLCSPPTLVRMQNILCIHMLSLRLCVCVCVQHGVIIYNTLRLNEAISHNAYSLTWWAGLGRAVVMSAQPLQIYSER